MWPGTFLNIADGQRDRAAAYAEWEARTGPQWTTLLGARYERVQTNTGDVRGYSTAAGAPGSQAADAARFNALDRERNDDNWDLTALLRHTSSASPTFTCVSKKLACSAAITMSLSATKCWQRAAPSAKSIT